MSIKVFIVDDHHSIADGFQSYSVNSNFIEYSGRAMNPEILRDVLPQKHDKIDILLLDTFGTERKFAGEVKRLHIAYPQLPMLILTSNDNINFARRLIDNGARGFLHKGLRMSEICESIKEVHTNPHRKVIRLSRTEPDDNEGETVKRDLTPTELQVIALMCRGFRNNAEMADILTSINNRSLSPLTIQTHRRNIKRKLKDYGVTNDSSLGYMVCKWNLLDGDELSSPAEK